MGAIFAFPVVGWIVERLGVSRVLIMAGMGIGLGSAVQGLGLANGVPWGFAIGNFLVGFSFPFINSAINAEGAALERTDGRTYMPQFHGAFSIGALLGMGIGTVASTFDVAAQVQVPIVGALYVLVHVWRSPSAVVDGHPIDEANRTPGGPLAMAFREYRDRRVLALGFVLIGAGTAEGAANGWLSIATVDGFAVAESTAGLFFGVFVAAMITVRWVGGRFVDRFGRVATVRASAASVTIGVLIFVFTPTIWAAPAGLLVWGFGAALAVPVTFSAAADDPKRATASVAAVSSFDMIGMLLGPIVIGSLAAAFGARNAMLVVVTGAILAWVLAGAARERAGATVEA